MRVGVSFIAPNPKRRRVRRVHAAHAEGRWRAASHTHARRQDTFLSTTTPRREAPRPLLPAREVLAGGFVHQGTGSSLTSAKNCSRSPSVRSSDPLGERSRASSSVESRMLRNPSSVCTAPSHRSRSSRDFPSGAWMVEASRLEDANDPRPPEPLQARQDWHSPSSPHDRVGPRPTTSRSSPSK